MKNKLLLASVPALLMMCFAFYRHPSTHADKANAFINSLTPDQQKMAVRPFYNLSPHEWSFLPASTSHPDGIAIKDLDASQKEKAYRLLEAYLSAKGYTKTKNIMDLEYVLLELSPASTIRIPENYFLAIYGTPHTDSTWGWSFQGHHIALNFTVVKDTIAFAPFFFGANPAEVKEGAKKGTRVIREEEDIAYELMNALSAQQKQKAIFQPRAFAEIVTSNATKVEPLPAAGISIKELTDGQKNILNKLLSAYLSSMPNDLANRRFKKIQAEDMNVIHFGWAGSTIRNEPHYYRIQGKTFLIEFDNTQNNANHIHTVWRDFDGDFGRDLLREHYHESHH